MNTFERGPEPGAQPETSGCHVRAVPCRQWFSMVRHPALAK